LFSLGRDGKPGGAGLDQDLDSRAVTARRDGYHRLPSVGIPTLRQFTFECGTGGVRIVCAIAGVAAFIACWISLRAMRKSPAISLFGLTVTLFACLFTALVMSALHVPSHH
jgi:hypothetical protein